MMETTGTHLQTVVFDFNRAIDRSAPKFISALGVRRQRNPMIRSMRRVVEITYCQNDEDGVVVDERKRMTESREVRRLLRRMDGFALLDGAGVDDPTDAQRACVSDLDLEGVVSEDLPYFSNLRYLDAGENHLQLCDLTPLQSLEELHLHCSGIQTIEGTPEFRSLTILNLSFNDLDESCWSSLIMISPCLRQLDLSYNNISAVYDISALQNLRILSLENNPLCLQTPSDIMWIELANCRNLSTLNVSKTGLRRIPRKEECVIERLSSLLISGNKFSDPSELTPLLEWIELRRIVALDTPLSRSAPSHINSLFSSRGKELILNEEKKECPFSHHYSVLRNGEKIVRIPSERLYVETVVPFEDEEDIEDFEGENAPFFVTENDGRDETEEDLERAFVESREGSRSMTIEPRGNVQQALRQLQLALQQPHHL